jgi:hypothetical protein
MESSPESEIQPATIRSARSFHVVWPDKWQYAVLPLAIGVLLQLACIPVPGLVDRYYSLGLYPHIARALGAVSSRIHFPLSEILLGLLLFAVIPAVPFSIYILFRLKGRRVSTINRWSKRLVFVAGLAFITFTLIWGLNYRRLPIATSMTLDRSQPSAPELEAISRDVISAINENFSLIHDESAPLSFDNQAELKELVEDAYRKNETLPWQVRRSGYSTPKAVLLPGLFARFGIAGVYSPFTAEPNFLGNMPGFDLPFSMAHEMAHARGYAMEDEADFVAFLVCVGSTDPRLRYSGYLSALRVVSPLAYADPERFRTVLKLLGDGPRSDLKTRRDFWQRYTGRASYLGARVNNLYLKANGVRSGIRNYDEVVSLIIGYYRKHRPDVQP